MKDITIKSVNEPGWLTIDDFGGRVRLDIPKGTQQCTLGSSLEMLVSVSGCTVPLNSVAVRLMVDCGSSDADGVVVRENIVWRASRDGPCCLQDERMSMFLDTNENNETPKYFLRMVLEASDGTKAWNSLPITTIPPRKSSFTSIMESI